MTERRRRFRIARELSGEIDEENYHGLAARIGSNSTEINPMIVSMDQGSLVVAETETGTAVGDRLRYPVYPLSAASLIDKRLKYRDVDLSFEGECSEVSCWYLITTRI